MIHPHPSSSLSLPLLISAFFALPTQAWNPSVSWTCYNPDGTPALYNDYMPCIDVSGVDSMCCALNRTNSNVDSCSQNGLCLSGGTYFRDYCTDPTWKSPNCLPKNVCADAATNTLNNTISMTQCVDGTWCCGSNNITDCCAKGLGFTLPAKLPIFQASSSSTSTNTSSSSSIVTVTATPSSSSSSSSSDTTKVGIAVGVALGVLAIAGSMLGFWLGQKRGMKRGQQKMGDGNGYALQYGAASPDVKDPMLGTANEAANGTAATSTTGYANSYGGGNHHHAVQEIDTEPRMAELGPGR